jgi:hypothetical protein
MRLQGQLPQQSVLLHDEQHDDEQHDEEHNLDDDLDDDAYVPTESNLLHRRHSVLQRHLHHPLRRLQPLLLLLPRLWRGLRRQPNVL